MDGLVFRQVPLGSDAAVYERRAHALGERELPFYLVTVLADHEVDAHTRDISFFAGFRHT